MNSSSEKLATNFIKCELSLSGQLYSTETKNNYYLDAVSLISSIEGQKTIFLQEKEPLFFSILFFTLLDFGHIPICVSSDLNQFQYEQFLKNMPTAGWIKNKEFTPPTIIEQNKYSNCYGCLTSGTTSSPKLCYLGISNAKENASAHAKSLGIDKHHLILQSLPLNHSFGLVVYLWTTLVTSNKLDFNLAFLGLRSLNKRNLSNCVIHLSPAQSRFVIKEKIDEIEGMDIVSIGGGLIQSDEVEKLCKKFKNSNVFTTYGLTEAGPRVTSGLWKSGKNTGHIGKPFTGISAKVLLSDNKTLLNTGQGHLCIQSPSLKLNLLQSEVIQDNWLKTRDIVNINPQGDIDYISREDDLINIGGISIYPKDIEAVARLNPMVDDCIVLKKRSDMYEEIPILVVKPTLDVKLLEDYLKERLNIYQMPKQIYSFDEFPQHSLNKIDRKALLAMCESL
ncbi:MAG: acyl--CoA ligase [Bacteriovoracaceae bacterium]|nr:acyl--CoA ligase [Bacteriovoracaceae bacterium]